MVWTLNFIPHSGVSCMTGSTWLFQTYSYKEGEKWATHFWLRPFYRQTHKQPWAFHPALKLSFVPFLQPQTPSPYCIVQCWCNQKCTASLYSFAYTTAQVKKISFMNPFLCIFSYTTTTLLDSFFFSCSKKDDLWWFKCRVCQSVPRLLRHIYQRHAGHGRCPQQGFAESFCTDASRGMLLRNFQLSEPLRSVLKLILNPV